MLRRIFAVILIIMLMGLAALPVLAATSAQDVQLTANVDAAGGYIMDMSVKIKLDQVTDDLPFPIPSDAKDVTLLGSRADTHRARGALQVELPARYLAAAIPVHYTAQGTLTRSQREGYLELDIPLLCGFQYPVESLSFAVTLPGMLDAADDPVKLLSNTHGQDIERYLTFQISGQTVSGQLVRPLKDGASLILHLTVPAAMFPQAVLESWSVSFDDIAMYVLTGVALVYWLVFLRCLPPRRIRSTTPPEGLSAGELGTALIGQGGDLTMMVLFWAQMGYILIHPDKHDRVMLHKRMDMGNERSAYEQRCFKLLFGKQTQISGTGIHYARLWHKVAALRPENRGYYRRNSGSTRIFRLILALVGALGGVSIGLALSGNAVIEILLAIVFAVLGFVTSLLMQDFVLGLHLRQRLRLALGLTLAGFWLGLGLLTGELVVALWMAVSQLLGGLAYGYGGMRTETGRQAMRRILGLRRYLKTVSKPELQRIGRERPEYFFQMAPAAMALGVDRVFAKGFGGKRMPNCPYLTTGMDAHMSATEWDTLLRKTVAALDRRAQRLPLDRLLGRQ